MAAVAAQLGSTAAGPPPPGTSTGPLLTAPRDAFSVDQTEKERKEKALQDKLAKRAAIVHGILLKFVRGYYAARLQMIAAARAAAAAKLAARGVKGRRRKKVQVDKGKREVDKGGKKKPVKTALQQAWAAFLADMDDRISKQKRVVLDDVYRGVFELSHLEQDLLAAALATTNKKVLPLDGMNIVLLNVVSALHAASAAAQLQRASALPQGGHLGLARLLDRGAGPEQLMQRGHTASALVAAGCPRHEVVRAAQHTLPALRQAGICPAELVTCPQQDALSQALLSGASGVIQLKQAGYTLRELAEAGLANPWAAKRAGYSLQECVDGGVTDPQQLRAGGYGDAVAQPVAPMAICMRDAMQHTDISTIPVPLTGTLVPPWSQMLLKKPKAVVVVAPQTRRVMAAGWGSRSGMTRAGASLISRGTVRGSASSDSGKATGTLTADPSSARLLTPE